MMKSNRIKNIIWASDLNDNTGEGTLGQLFIKKLLHKKKERVLIKTPDHEYVYKKKFKNINLKKQKSLFHKYISPIFGAIYLRVKSSNNQIIYVNYLPLWNFIIFLILPKKTILGPVTGSIFKGKVDNFNFLIRAYIFPVFVKISLIIIKKKFKNIFFSTDLLKSKVKKNNMKYLYNFVFCYFVKDFPKYKKKKDERKYKFLFYNKDHITKKNLNLINFLKKLSKEHTIYIIGDNIKYTNFFNFGYLKKNRINTILKKTEYVVSTNENIYSMFNIESINNGATIIYDKKITNNAVKNYGFIVPINFENKKINLPKKEDYYQNKLSFVQSINNHKNDFLKLFNNIIS